MAAGGMNLLVRPRVNLHKCKYFLSSSPEHARFVYILSRLYRLIDRLATAY